MRACARCGVHGDDRLIHVHHKNSNKKDNRPENLIYLCSRCHMQFHSGMWDYTSNDLILTHIPEKEVGILLADRRIVIPEKVYLGLEEIAANERKKVDNPVIKAMITPASVAQHILAVATKRGHYVGKKGVRE